VASTLTQRGELTFVSFPIEKTEVDPATGDVMVYGRASDGSLDSDEQIIDSDFAAKAIQDWLQDGANIRVQHNPQRDPAGVGVEADTDSTGATWVKGRIVEPIAQKLVNAGALRAYSVGIARPTIVRDPVARGGRITDGQVVEISLVDRPANKNCSIQLVKAAKDGSPERSNRIDGNEDFINKAAGVDLVKDSIGGHHVAGTPDTFTHDWLHIGPAGIADDHVPANQMSKADLKAHLSGYHSGGPIGGRRVGPKNPSKAELLHYHEEMHNALARNPFQPVTSDGALVAPGSMHTHGIGNVPKPDYRGKSIDPDITKVGPEGYIHGWIKVDPGDSDKIKATAAKLQHSGRDADEAAAAKHLGNAADVADQHILGERGQHEMLQHLRKAHAYLGDSHPDEAKEIQGHIDRFGEAAKNGKSSLEEARGDAPEPAKRHAFFGKNEGGASVTTLAEETVSLTLPADVSVAFTPADLAKVLALKSKSSNVGEDKTPGGVDRDSMPGQDFAGKDRSFPIHSPGDVSDAAQSIGRAGDDNHSPEQLKTNIKRIAHRKGPDYVAQLPDSWKNEDSTVDKAGEETEVEKAEDAKPCTLCHGGGKIRDGNVTCPRCHGDGKISTGESDEHGDSQDDDSDDNDNDNAEKSDAPALSKKKKKITIETDDNDDSDDDGDDDDDDDSDGDGGDSNSDADNSNDDADNSDDDDSDDNNDDDDEVNKASDTPIFGKNRATCVKCGGVMKAKHQFCSACGAAAGSEPEKTGAKKSVAEPDLVKGGARSCKECGKNYHADSKRVKCKNCGTKLPAASKSSEVDVTKGVSPAVDSPSPADGVKGHDTKPMAQHREPDGAEVEAYEDDSGMQEGDQNSAPAQPTHLEQPTLKADASSRAMQRILKFDTSQHLGILHDLTCPAFHPSSIAKCYPERDLVDEMNVEEFQQKSLNLTASLPYHQAAKASLLGAHASILKSADQKVLDEARSELHKAFSDANPGPGTAPTPASDIMPGSYNRPYVTMGHAAPSPQQGPPNTTPVVSGSINAEQFTRPALVVGEAAPSPVNNGPMSMAVTQALQNVAMANDMMSGLRATGGSIPGSVPIPIMPQGLQTGLSGVPNVTAMKSRTFYSHASKDQVKAAMQGIHDHVANVFPDLCPMKHDDDDQTASKAVAPPVLGEPVTQDNVVIPRQLTKSATTTAATTIADKVAAGFTKKDLKRQRKIEQIEKRLVEEAAFALAAIPKAEAEPEVTKAETVTGELSVTESDGVREAIENLSKQIAERDELLVKQSKQLKKAQKAIDELSSQPDPAVNAYRGGMLTAPTYLAKQASATQSAVPDMADVQNRTKAMMLHELEDQFRNSADPSQREAAWKSILTMRGL